MSEESLEREACVNRSFQPERNSLVFSDIVTSGGYARSIVKLAEPYCVSLTLGSARNYSLF